MRKTVGCLCSALGLLGFLLSYSVARAGTADLRARFEGKTLRILHGSTAGGGYDLVARAFAQVVPEYLPGRPARVLVEPRPGGGPSHVNSLRALIKAKPDGLTIGFAHTGWIVAEILGEGPAGYDLDDLKPLGTPLGGYSDNVYCANREVATSWEDIEKLGHPIKWGGIAPGPGAHLIAAPWLAQLGAPIKIIFGYGGSTEMSAAFRRGETELASSCNTGLLRDYPDWVNRDHVAPIFWVGKATEAGDETLKKMGLKRPPHIYEVGRKYITADWQKNVFDLDLNLARLSKMFFVPEGVSKEVLATWREVFRRVVNDPRFAKALHPTVREDLAPMYAEEAESIFTSRKGLGSQERKMLKFLVTGER